MNFLSLYEKLISILICCQLLKVFRGLQNLVTSRWVDGQQNITIANFDKVDDK